MVMRRKIQSAITFEPCLELQKEHYTNVAEQPESNKLNISILKEYGMYYL